jgi:excisionase family DNA binding protein
MNNVQKLTFLPTAVPQGDGSIVVRPGKPLDRLTLRQAAKRAGCSRNTIYRLYHAGILKGERPGPRKIFIFADSLEQHLESCQDKQFWNRGSVRKKYKRSL